MPRRDTASMAKPRRLLDEQVVEHGRGRAAEGGGRRVERHGVETLPRGVEEVSGRHVAAEEAAVDQPADLAAVARSTAPMRAASTGAAERGETTPSGRRGPARATNGRARRRRGRAPSPLELAALGAHAEERRRSRSARRRSVPSREPGRAACAARVSDPERPARRRPGPSTAGRVRRSRARRRRATRTAASPSSVPSIAWASALDRARAGRARACRPSTRRTPGCARRARRSAGRCRRRRAPGSSASWIASRWGSPGAAPREPEPRTSRAVPATATTQPPSHARWSRPARRAAPLEPPTGEPLARRRRRAARRARCARRRCRAGGSSGCARGSGAGAGGSRAASPAGRAPRSISWRQHAGERVADRLAREEPARR